LAYGLRNVGLALKDSADHKEKITMTCKTNRLLVLTFIALVALTLAVSAFSQGASQPVAQSGPQVALPDKPVMPSTTTYSTGQKTKIEGTIVERSADGFKLRMFDGPIASVNLVQNTEVKERKSNPFRRAKNYGVTSLLPGLEVEVNGHGSSSGALIADEIRFRQDDYRLANVMDARVKPVETRLNSDETRLSQTEENANKLSGQISEVSEVSHAARSGAKSAQDAADNALETAKSVGEEAQNGIRVTNERITSIDDYDMKNSVTVNFKIGSSVLSDKAKEELDKLAGEAKNEKGFVIEVAGFASSDGNVAFNQELSQRRADAVIHYLAENYGIPLRRFITPMGYGEKLPVADNSTLAGRVQNRRVEVRILVNKGLTQSAMTSPAAH
jgi:OmpA-OmpF porin, OOP family